MKEKQIVFIGFDQDAFSVFLEEIPFVSYSFFKSVSEFMKESENLENIFVVFLAFSAVDAEAVEGLKQTTHPETLVILAASSLLAQRYFEEKSMRPQIYDFPMTETGLHSIVRSQLVRE